MKANKKQKQLIHVNSPSRDVKEEFVQWATGDNSKISTNDLTFEQANAILKQLGKQPIKATKEDAPLFWGYFNKNEKSHLQILSHLRQLNWTVKHPTRGVIPDLERFGQWLQSDRSPVQKPLKQMTATEVSKIIEAQKVMIKKLYK